MRGQDKPHQDSGKSEITRQRRAVPAGETSLVRRQIGWRLGDVVMIDGKRHVITRLKSEHNADVEPDRRNRATRRRHAADARKP